MDIHKYIANIPEDKKKHRILGQIINPRIIIISVLLVGLFFNDPITGGAIGCTICFFVHGFIEWYQKTYKKGNPEWLDFKAGSYSAFWYLILFIILKIIL